MSSKKPAPQIPEIVKEIVSIINKSSVTPSLKPSNVSSQTMLEVDNQIMMSHKSNLLPIPKTGTVINDDDIRKLKDHRDNLIAFIENENPNTLYETDDENYYIIPQTQQLYKLGDRNSSTDIIHFHAGKLDEDNFINKNIYDCIPDLETWLSLDIKRALDYLDNETYKYLMGIKFSKDLKLLKCVNNDKHINLLLENIRQKLEYGFAGRVEGSVAATAKAAAAGSVAESSATAKAAAKAKAEEFKKKMGDRYEIANTIFDLEGKTAAQKSRCFINIFKFLFGISSSGSGSGSVDINKDDDIFEKDINMDVNNQHKMLLYLKKKLPGIIVKAAGEQKREDEAKKKLELITTQSRKSGTVSSSNPTTVITTQPRKSGKVSSSNATTIINTQPKKTISALPSKEIEKAEAELETAKGKTEFRKCCWWELTGNLKTHQFIDIYLKRATKKEDTGELFLTKYGTKLGQRISYLLFDRIAAFILCFGSKNTATNDRDYYGWYFPKKPEGKSVWADGELVTLEQKIGIDKEKVTRKREKELEEIMVYSIEPDLLRVDSNAIIELIGKIEYLIKNPNYKYDRAGISEEDFMKRLTVLNRQQSLKNSVRNLHLAPENHKARTSLLKKFEAASAPTAEGIQRKKRTKKKRKPKRKKTKNKKKKPKRKTKQSNN